MISESDVRYFLSGDDIYPLIDDADRTPIDQLLRDFHNVLIRDRGLASQAPEAGRAILGARDRLAGVWSVVVERRMPDWPAFGPLRLEKGDVETDYDRMRHFLISHKAGTTHQPVDGMFYPELITHSPIDRVIALAEAHVGCQPTSRRTANLHSLQGRFPATVAQKAAQPHGTTCALFLRAVLVAAGDGRFVRHPDRLGLDKPGRGNMAHGMGCGYPALAGDGQKTVGRPGGDPRKIRRGDLYYVSAAHGDWTESGHVGLIVEANAAGGSIELFTVDGGQKEGDEVWSPGKGWFTHRKRGVIRMRGQNWEKCARDPRGVVIPPKVQVENYKTKETDKKMRTLRNWVAMSEVAGGFTDQTIRIDGRTIHTTL